MKISFKRILAIVLAAAMLCNMALVQSFAAHSEKAEDSLESIIEQQVKDFASSINKSGADSDAAMALALYGIGGNGKLMSVGEDHALTAVLMNAELTKYKLARGCIEAINAIKKHGVTSVLDDGGGYFGANIMCHTTTILGMDNRVLYRSDVVDYSGNTNEYDNALVWMVGSLEIHSIVTREKVTRDSVIYNVSVQVVDSFDFNTNDGSVPREIASLLGSVLFREFDWEANADFCIQIPNTCTHTGEYIINTVEATCANQGYTEHICEQCGYVANKDNYVSALGHSYGTWSTKTAPTCTTKGEEQRRCSTCKQYETRAVAVLGHDTVLNAGQAPTCTEKGWSDYETCSRCNHSTYSQLSPTGHNYISTIVPPTCTEKGYTSYDCTDCGGSYATDYVVKTGHSYGKWYVKTEATCTESGEKRKDCLNCDYYDFREISPNGHSYKVNITPSTCTDGGYTTYTCSCGDSYISDHTEALGHDMIAYEAKYPTCVEVGWSEYEACVRCDHSTYEEIEATGHSIGEWYTTLHPTCVEKGTEQRDCDRCDYYESREIDSLSHDLILHEAKAPTCMEIGWNEYESCSRCDHSTYEELPIIDHIYESGACTMCGEKDPDAVVKGDIDGDGKITALDLFKMKLFIKQLINTTDTDAADVNGDGKLNTVDLFDFKYRLLKGVWR